MRQYVAAQDFLHTNSALWPIKLYEWIITQGSKKV